MKLVRFRLFLTLFLDNPATIKFAFGMILGLAFSIAVILSTMGMMDGFDRTLKRGLKRSVGDVAMHSRHGFFLLDAKIKHKFTTFGIIDYSAVVQTESFFIFNDESRGVQVKGIDHAYGKVVDIDFKLSTGEIAIGSEIAKIHQISPGDELVLAFGKGNVGLKSMPTLERFKVSQVINHGVYQKDARLVYVRLADIQRILDLKSSINMVSFNLPPALLKKQNSIDGIESILPELRKFFGLDYFFKPYWREFAPLLKAVQAEKFMISLVLQMIVIISVFNILAFIIFINEKKSKELFLFKALGMSRKSMSDLWLKLVFSIWILSCALSILLVEIFKFAFMHLSLFELPSEIYYMPRIELFLSWKDYLFVFSLALVWIMLITFYLLKRLKQKSLLEGLRQEFA